MKLYLFVLFFLFHFYHASAQIKLSTFKNDLETKQDSIQWINSETAVQGKAFSGEFFSSTDSVRLYGLGYKGGFPASCLNKNLHIKFSEQIRTSHVGNEFAMVISVTLGDSVIYWEAKKIASRISTPGEWQKIEDVVELPGALASKENNLAIYLWNMDGKSIVDIDDLQIDFEERTLPSFLPPVAADQVLSKDGWTRVHASEKFTLLYQKESGAIQILSESGDTLFGAMGFYSEWLENKRKKQSWSNHFFLRKDSTYEGGKYVLLNSRDDFAEYNLEILLADNKITFKTNSFLKKQAMLVRQSFVGSYGLPLKEVYKKSTLGDTSDFKREYWLDKEGFRLSDGTTSLLLYRPDASSIQLDNSEKRFVINIDYSADHPMLHFPLLKKNENKYEDYSLSDFKSGDTLKSSFTFYSIPADFKMARMMQNPNGYQASFVWTEHADYTNLRTQRAVYFGSEKIVQLNDATGGFLKYSIPVTKSIFYSNPDKVDNSEKWGYFPGPVASMKESEDFRMFLRQLNEFGIEICLHTPDHYTSDRKLLAEALEATKREFFPMSWIDHGYDNSEKSNREDLACDGFKKSSKNYSADLWKSYNIRYFWNSFYEDSGLYKDYSFNSFFSVPYSGMDDGFPTPVYWRHKSRTDNIIHWRTTSTLDPPDGSLWSYYFNDLRLTDLVNNRNTIIIHGYPARVDSTNGFYELKDNLVVANEEFNKALQRLSSYRTMEKIWLTTIRDMMNFRTSLEKVSYEITAEGKIRLQNQGKDIINGLSLSVYANEITSGSKSINSKKYHGEVIAWFDILPGEIVELSVK